MTSHRGFFLKFLPGLAAVPALVTLTAVQAFALPAPSEVSSIGYDNPTVLTVHTTNPFNSVGASTLVAFVSTHPAWPVTTAPQTVFISSLSDNVGNTWHLLTGPTKFAGSTATLLSAIYYVNAPFTSATHTVTIHLTSGAPLVAHVFAVSGSDVTGPPISSAITDPGAGGTSASVTTAPITSPANSLLLAWVKNETVATASAVPPYTLDAQSVPFLWAESRTALIAGSYTGQFLYSSAIGWQTAIVGLRGPVAPATTFTPAPGSPDAVGTNPESVAVGDFNNDGNQDLAIANFGGFVSILLGNGDGSFQPQSLIPAGAAPRAIAVGDFNADGCPDLVVVNSLTGISVLINNKSGSACLGTFALPVPYTAGATPETVAVGDFNNDGILDLAVPNNGDNTVSVLLGVGNGTFHAAVNYPVGQGPSGVAVGDFNQDGNADLAVVNSSGGSISILVGNGTGTFTPSGNILLGSSFRTLDLAQVIVVADFNHDGHQDLAIAADLGVIVLLGNGDATFQSPLSNPLDSGGIAVGDFNGDGNLDLVVTEPFSKDLSVLIGNGDGTFKSPANFLVGTLPTSVAVGDFNGDGRLDVAVSNFGDNDVTVLLGTVWHITACAVSGPPPCPVPSPPQAVGTNKVFPLPLIAQVTDAGGAAVPGAIVTFTPPSTGASATLNPSTPQTTNGNGVAQVTATANSSPGGPYTVTAMVGFAGTAGFTLTNKPGDPIFAVGGTPQSAVINTAFPSQLMAKVTDGSGNAIAGQTVTFLALGSGPSGTFPGGVTVAWAITDGSGLATSPVFTANSKAGTYVVRATTPSAAASFYLTNTPGPAKTIVATSGSGQNTGVNTTFKSPLLASVTDVGGNPVPGVKVTFTVPSSGASGSFLGGVNTAVTDATGTARSAPFLANAKVGTYYVTANATGVLTSATYVLTNTAGPPAHIVVRSGNGQNTAIGTPFTNRLVATVTDGGGNPVPGVLVAFVAPPLTSASGTFSTSNTAITNAAGVATSPTFTANGIRGTYTVNAYAAGVAMPASFVLTNR